MDDSTKQKNVRAKKSLGQNFLKSKGALRDIVAAGNLSPEDIVIEVGPGKGVLTEELVARAHRVIAIEKDERLIEYLNEKFKNEIQQGKLELINQDILEFDPTSYKLTPNSYKLIANIPYYITGQFLRKFLSLEVSPFLMVLMVQKEVASRIVTRDNKESILSISVKAYCTPRYISTVKAQYFSPKPKVDSAIILLNNISKGFFDKDTDENSFFSLVKAGFAHKRKKLIGNLEHYGTKDKLREFFKICSISENARSEDISLETWKCLHSYLTQNSKI